MMSIEQFVRSLMTGLAATNPLEILKAEYFQGDFAIFSYENTSDDLQRCQ